MRQELERRMDAGVEPTLAMRSAAGEIPYGGRSNQFLHNDTLYAALDEGTYHFYADAADSIVVRTTCQKDTALFFRFYVK